MDSTPKLGIQNFGFNATQLDNDSPHKKKVSTKSAIEIISGIKRFGKKVILNRFTMHVNQGAIYSLLGASGCGKTTALSCMIGISKLDKGKVSIFGEKPGTAKSGVPGKRVGYMPQTIALNREFTMTEVLHYFGKIYGMSRAQVKERIEFFLEFLNLHSLENRQLDRLSEGQRRRISFAVALVHEPEILILDEPTVGVDPLLRKKIWEHLEELTHDRNVTTIITTHYIEETKNSTKIGLMRNGYLLVEETPAALLETFKTTSMEDIVFQLCLRDGSTAEHALAVRNQSLREGTRGRKLNQIESEETSFSCLVDSNKKILSDKASAKRLTTRSIDRLSALFRKNLIVAHRSIWLWLFVLLMPALNIYLICACQLVEPKDLKFGIVNHEIPTGQQCLDELDFCLIANLSCNYIRAIGDKTVMLVDFETEGEALEAVRNGDTYGYLSIPQNFSDNLYDRLNRNDDDPTTVNEKILGSQIYFQLDVSNNIVGLKMKHLFYDAFRMFTRSLQESCGENPDEYDIPLVFGTPVYGDEKENTGNYIVARSGITFLSFLASLTCGLAFIIEKNDGMLTRGSVAGITNIEIMLSHLSVHFVVLLFQAILIFFVMFFAFDIHYIGSIVLAFAIFVLNGVTGMSLGFLSAIVCDRERNAMMIAIGVIIPALLVSGTITTFEALPTYLQYVGFMYPGTLPAFALTAILFKGWGLTYFTVWLGFAAATGWIIVYWVLIVFYNFRYS